MSSDRLHESRRRRGRAMASGGTEHRSALPNSRLIFPASRNKAGCKRSPVNYPHAGLRRVIRSLSAGASADL